MHGWLSTRAATGNELIYVANGNEIVIFPKRPRNSPPIGMISDGVSFAYGLFVDKAKNLYVCNQLPSSVTVYPPGATSPSATYTQGLNRPLYVVTDRRRVFVGNAGDGSIAIFKKDDGTKRGTLQTLGTEVDGLSLDAQGNLLAAYRNGSQGGIEVFPDGVGNGKDLGIKLTAPQGLVVDPFGDILVVETEVAHRVDFFLRHHTVPFQTVQVPYVPTQIQLGDEYNRLYISDLNAMIYDTTYPELGTPRAWIDNSLEYVQGVAVSPRAQP